MKDYLAELVRSSPDPVQGRNVAREYLQPGADPALLTLENLTRVLERR